jgi:hypothetical protein
MAITHAPLVSAMVIPKLFILKSPRPFNFRSVYAFSTSNQYDCPVPMSSGTVTVPIHFTPRFTFINLPSATSPDTFSHSHYQLHSSSSFAMASSSSASSIISYESESSREPTPEYEVRAPLHWDAEEWDFRYQSEDDEP